MIDVKNLREQAVTMTEDVEQKPFLTDATEIVTVCDDPNSRTGQMPVILEKVRKEMALQKAIVLLIELGKEWSRNRPPPHEEEGTGDSCLRWRRYFELHQAMIVEYGQKEVSEAIKRYGD